MLAGRNLLSTGGLLRALHPVLTAAASSNLAPGAVSEAASGEYDRYHDKSVSCPDWGR